MKLLLISAFLLGAACHSSYRYNIEDYVDDAVEEFNMKVLKAGDEYIALEDPLSVGGFVLTRPMLADMSSLERVGLTYASLNPLPDGVEVSATFRFGKLHMDGTNLTGPGKNVDKPRISARGNMVEVKFKAEISTATDWDEPDLTIKKCFATYEAALTDVSSVVLVTNKGVTPLDEWTHGLFHLISNQINPFLNAVFEKHFDLCQTLKNNGYKWSVDV